MEFDVLIVELSSFDIVPKNYATHYRDFQELFQIIQELMWKKNGHLELNGCYDVSIIIYDPVPQRVLVSHRVPDSFWY